MISPMVGAGGWGSSSKNRDCGPEIATSCHRVPKHFIGESRFAERLQVKATCLLHPHQMERGRLSWCLLVEAPILGMGPPLMT